MYLDVRQLNCARGNFQSDLGVYSFSLKTNPYEEYYLTQYDNGYSDPDHSDMPYHITFKLEIT